MDTEETVEVVCLDAGNTLVGMRFERIAALLAHVGIWTSAAALERAEARARPVVSQHLAGGRSSEDSDTGAVQVRCVLEGIGVPAAVAAAQAPQLARRIRAELPSRRLWTRVLPGVPAALQLLRTVGLRLVVVSNSDGTLEALLEDVGLRGLVDEVIDSAVVGVEKPHPAIWTTVLADLGVPPARAIHVGDLYAVDVAGARAAGLEAVLLDPFGDWGDTDCPRLPDLAAFARAFAAEGAAPRGEAQRCKLGS